MSRNSLLIPERAVTKSYVPWDDLQVRHFVQVTQSFKALVGPRSPNAQRVGPRRIGSQILHFDGSSGSSNSAVLFGYFEPLRTTP